MQGDAGVGSMDTANNVEIKLIRECYIKHASVQVCTEDFCSKAATRLHPVANFSHLQREAASVLSSAENTQEALSPAGVLPSYFGGEEEALTLAVGRWDTLQLEEVEEDLHLRKNAH